ncbi:SpoIIE family protein phosphatase [uncultured Maricaulis sp.]|uniref:PP2C family protein-serine/threonine phosphatase n=1 Tax=uncultured Maricaulis sp. TaxID=174710 RepID=UPI00262D4A4F|nr:SpoIIE family protein phosphatase [uncultured Maricaulis sp.]
MPGDVDANQIGQTADNALILIVDDLRSSRSMIASILNAAGFPNHLFASDGVEALAILEREPVEMVILDIVMPNKDGFDVCREVRQRLRLNVPILIQTALQDADERASAFDAGASDVISKPIHPHEIASRVRLHLERRRMLDRLQRYQRRMDDELQAAEAMQISLLKSDEDVAAIASPRGADLWTFYKASNRLGGDLWQVFEIDETRFGLFMVDLSGHGVAAAINAFRVHMLTDALSRHRSRPARFLAAVNNYLCQMLPVEHFATAFYGVVDPSVGKMDYAIAGAPAPIVLQASGGWQALEGSGLILGCAPKTDYEAYEVDLERGDRVLCYSDGLYENFERPELSLEPADIARLACELLPVERGPGFLPALIERLFEGPDAQSQDDLTLLFLEVRGHG